MGANEAVAMKKMTFDEICKAEPKIKRLHRIACMIGRKRGKPFCANLIWYDLIKPQMHKIVGHARRRRRQEYEAWLDQHPEIKARIGKHGFLFLNCFEAIKYDTTRPSYVEPIPELETSYAYGLVYSTIYDALPDCNHDGLCW